MDAGSRLIVSPVEGRSETIVPVEWVLDDVCESTGTGTLFPDEGTPILHLHLACGRREKTVTGCVCRGVNVWHVREIVLIELAGSAAVRFLDPVVGFKLLNP